MTEEAQKEEGRSRRQLDDLENGMNLPGFQCSNLISKLDSVTRISQ